ncbi:MAG: energy-coupling factor transporter ATPase, partial [Clostridia bacterium]|nr:energy-coupling factor transporter ATPase [Clostridia bacterium]
EIYRDGTPKEVFSDVDGLRRVGLDVPQGRELLYELSRSGINFDDNPIDIENCAKLILEKYNVQK